LSPLIEAGNLYLPHPDWHPWVHDFIDECVQFPNGAHDDQVDAMTQMLLRWHQPVEERVVVSYGELAALYGRDRAQSPWVRICPV
jgi:hypothetical protein